MLIQENRFKLIITISACFLLFSIVSINSPWMKAEATTGFFGSDLEYYIDEVVIPMDDGQWSMDYATSCLEVDDDLTHICEYETPNKILKFTTYIVILMTMILLLLVITSYIEKPIILGEIDHSTQKTALVIPSVIYASNFAIWFFSTPGISLIEMDFKKAGDDYVAAYSYGFYLYLISVILSIASSWLIYTSDIRIIKQTSRSEPNGHRLQPVPVRKLKLKEKLESIENLFNENIITDEERVKLREKEIDNFN